MAKKKILISLDDDSMSILDNLVKDNNMPRSQIIEALINYANSNKLSISIEKKYDIK